MTEDKDKFCGKKMMRGGGTSNAVYGFGFIGALVYYLGHATTIWMGVVGIFKAVIWPAIVIYKWLEFLKM